VSGASAVILLLLHRRVIPACYLSVLDPLTCAPPCLCCAVGFLKVRERPSRDNLQCAALQAGCENIHVQHCNLPQMQAQQSNKQLLQSRQLWQQ
jgi:hypothetical protein